MTDNNITIDWEAEIAARRAAAGRDRWNISATELLAAYAAGVMDFKSARLRDANLSGADLRDASLRNASLRNANLSGAALNRVNLTGAYLRDANLTDADLQDANLAGADMQRANLTDANLSGAQLRDANLREMNLMGANLMGSHLHNANLSGTEMAGARHIASISNVGTEARTIYAVTHTGGPMFHIGCFWGGYEAATAAVTKKYSAPEYSRHLKSYLLALDTLAALLEAQNDGGE